jgi:glyoxylase-like metal-dependent hydrolase (beta-lactamase superfamily II)
MSRVLAAALFLVTLDITVMGQALSSQGANPPTKEVNWNARMPWSSWEAGVNTWWANFPRAAQRMDPFKIFDNVYYVGIQAYQSLLVPTSDGLILIDATYDDTASFVLESIRTLGFDPANIRYILISHGHNDHFAGAGRIKQAAPKSRVGTSAADWSLIESQQGQPNAGLPLTRDLVINDGDVITVGDTQIKVYVTPGHSAGALAFEIPARFEGRTYRVVNPRVGIRIPANMTEPYIKSMERLKALGPWDGYLPEHSFLSMRPQQVDARAFYVGPAAAPKPEPQHASLQGWPEVSAFFDALLAVAREKLAYEKKGAP